MSKLGLPIPAFTVGLLDSPCRWCGYNGSDYWKAGSHAVTCPWRDVGGREERLTRLPAVISNPVKALNWEGKFCPVISANHLRQETVERFQHWMLDTGRLATPAWLYYMGVARSAPLRLPDVESWAVHAGNFLSSATEDGADLDLDLNVYTQTYPVELMRVYQFLVKNNPRVVWIIFDSLGDFIPEIPIYEW
jgi:hypothetical protein